MTGRPRRSKRKDVIVEMLQAGTPKGFGLLNELRVKAWRNGNSLGANSYSSHRRSFTRTITTHSHPLVVHKISRPIAGVPRELTADIFARWALWQFIERGYLSSGPDQNQFFMVMGYDACSGFIRMNDGSVCVVGTTCFLENLWVIFLEGVDFNSLGNNSQIYPHPIMTIGDDQVLTKINPKTSVRDLPYLNHSVSMPNGHSLSTAKISLKK